MANTKNVNSQIKTTINLDKLFKIKNELSKGYITRVGVLGSKTNRLANDSDESHKTYKKRVTASLKSSPTVSEGEKGELTNAEIGMMQEFGVFSRQIPRRSFLEMPLQMKLPAYAPTFAKNLLQALEQGDIQPAYVNLGIKAEAIVQDAFATRGFGEWAPNAASTIARKGSSQPLIDTAQLRKSISSDVIVR